MNDLRFSFLYFTPRQFLTFSFGPHHQDGWIYHHKDRETQIIALKQEKVEKNNICTPIGRSKATVVHVLAASQNLPPDSVPQPKPCPGKQNKTSPKPDALIKCEVMQNPFIISTEIKKMYPELLQDVASRTICERLQKHLGLPAYKAAIKPLLIK